MPVRFTLLHDYSSIKNTKLCQMGKKNEQTTSHTDGFMEDIHLNCVTWITFFLNLRVAALYVANLTSRVCVELGKILVICKK